MNLLMCSVLYIQVELNGIHSIYTTHICCEYLSQCLTISIFYFDSDSPWDGDWGLGSPALSTLPDSELNLNWELQSEL